MFLVINFVGEPQNECNLTLLMQLDFKGTSAYVVILYKHVKISKSKLQTLTLIKDRDGWDVWMNMSH